MTDASTSLKVVQFIAADRTRVFRAWTDANLIAQWFAPGDMTVPFAEADARVGGAYKIEMRNAQGETFTTYGEYLEIVSNEKLVFSWGWERPDRHVSEVTVEFIDKNGGTEVVLTHVRHRDAEAATSHTDGWQKCLAKLAETIAELDSQN